MPAGRGPGKIRAERRTSCLEGSRHGSLPALRWLDQGRHPGERGLTGCRPGHTAVGYWRPPPKALARGGPALRRYVSGRSRRHSTADRPGAGRGAASCGLFGATAGRALGKAP